MPANPQPNWRDLGNESSSASSNNAGSRPWQPGDEPAGDSMGPSKRGIKRTIALFALIGIAIAFGAVVIWIRPIPPACLVTIGSGYETNLLFPSNVHGWNGLVNLDKEVAEASGGLGKFWRWDQPTKLRQVGDRPIEMEDQSWSAMWDKINIPSYEEATVVIFLSMHGMADDKEAYLLPNLPSKQALKSFDTSRIPFREVLDSLVAVKKKNVVLLLDVSHVQSYWPIGMLHNDFVKRLQEKYDHEINDAKHLTVICSSSPNQRSWASDELQKTVFSHFVAQGLKGGGHKAKDNVNALSLFEYVKEKVDTWAQTNRARNQTPLLLGGAERARGMALVHVAEPPEEKQPEVAAFPAAKMLSEWNQWKELKTDHAPHVHSPHLWRLYQETLLRYEQLMRAGDPTAKAAELKKTLSTLYGEIAVSRSLDRAYKCLGNSFPMNQVLGFPITEPIADPELQAFLLELRNVHNIKGDNEKEKSKVFDRFNSRTVLEKQYIQTRLSQLILQQMNRMATPDRAREQVLLAEIEERLRAAQRPAEVHLVRMFADVDPKADEKTIQLALRVRMLAEEAALSARNEGSTGELYSEVIFRWIRKDMEQADLLRREGEDYLFGDPKVHGKIAQKKLQDAEKAYSEVRAKAINLQTAMLLRDEVSAELPYMAGWLALPHPHQNKEAMQANRMAAELLGNRLAVLSRDLDDATRELPPHPDTLAQIAKEIQSMREKYREVCEGLKVGVGLQQNWHGIDAALTVPPMDVRDIGLRIALLSKQRDISGQLIANKAPEGRTEEEEAPVIRVERERKLFQASIKSLHEMRAADKENVDDGVRSFFFKLPGEILAKSDLAVDRKDLVVAANMCRGIPGAFVDFVKDETKKRVNPVDRLRRTNMGRLLQWQAKRGLEDHWFDRAKETPYYKTAAEAYLTSASNLFDEGQMPDALRNEATTLNKQLAYVSLKVARPEKLYWTTDPDLTFPYKVEADPGMPVGMPMVWVEVTRGKTIEKVWPRKTVDPWKNPADKYILDNASFAGAGEMIVHLHAYYRGQHIKELTTTVRAQPNVIVKNSPALKENTSLAVRMDSTFDYGAISIVLDTSGSMEFQHPKVGGKDRNGDPKKKNRRFDFALDALEYVLRKVPEKTELSVFTFGDNIASPISTFRASSPWLREDLGTMRKRLDVMPLGGGSPIADAIIRTMDDGFPIAGFKGPRLILVLTDGADTTSNVRAGAGRDDRVAQLLKAAHNEPRNRDIGVVVVCFIDKEAEKEEYDSAAAQFDVVKSFGKFLDVSEGPKLGKSIDEMVRPRVQVLKLSGQSVAGFEKGSPINFRLDQSLAWKHVAPDHYKANVLQTSPNPLVELEMRSGEKLFTVLHRMDNKLSLRRGILAYQKEARDRQTLNNEKQGWIVSLFENENRGFKAEQLLVIEKKEVDPDRIRQPIPGFAWVELDAVKGAKPDKTLRYWRDWNVPAAAYRVEMEGWAPNRYPKISTWFWPQEDSDFLRNRALVRTKNYPVPTQADPQAALENNSIIESINWREAEVEDAAGNKIKKDCLIVRARHAPGRPVWVDLGSRGPNVGSEHHYFTEASSCTTFFYGLSRRELVDLTLMDIVDFKTAAESVDFSPDSRIELPGLFAPQ